MSDRLIEQIIYSNPEQGIYRCLARSPGVAEDWLAIAERICSGFGERPAGLACPLALFAQPFDRKRVAIVQVADQAQQSPSGPILAFRLLLVPRRLYADLEADLFRISEQFPPDWTARGEMSSLEWTAGPAIPRSVDDIRRVLNVPADRTATLLGGAQVLVDGGRVLFVRQAPDPGMVRDLWTLLPSSTRLELWPATFAFSNRHRFSVIVSPHGEGPEFAHYMTEEGAGDYPEGRYEFALQHAAETSNQAEIDALLARPSQRSALRMALIILAVLALMSLVLNVPVPRPEEEAGQPPPAVVPKAPEEKR